MNNDILTEVRIDNYLLGRMSEAERTVFERELEENQDLREEYECQKEVAHAIQMVAMREFLARHAASRRRGRGLFGSGKRILWIAASVAAMFVAVVGGINYASAVKSLRDNGLLAYSSLEVSVSRDGNRLDSLIESIYGQIGDEEFDAATETLYDARSYITARISMIDGFSEEIIRRDEKVLSEEEAYEREILKMKQYDLDWYDAIILMRQGKVFKARRALKSIASSDSPYAEMAKAVLSDLY